MKKKKIAYIVVLCFGALMWGCSTKKNTWLSRNYQSFETRYNIKFNAMNSFEQGVEALRTGNKDDYSDILSLYPAITTESGNAISGQMNTTIEKCRKAIKLHSIRKKPTKKPAAMSDRQYQIFKKQEEYNNQVPAAWVLLGKAEYYKGDFIGAISEFNYVMRHYPEKNVLVYEAKLWKVFSYTEMDWLNEAESELNSIKEKEVPYQMEGNFQAFKANLLIKQKRYKEAIPVLALAIKKCNSRYELSRFEFVLGQLYELDGQKNIAAEHFSKASRKALNYEMIFNSQLKEYQTLTNTQKAIKGLEKMAKSSNNKDYLDQIYCAVGNRYLEGKNKPKAIEYYKKAMQLSTRNGLEKALVALTLGELYYAEKEYINAAPCYDSVVKMMPSTHQKYKRAENLSQILGELVQNYNTAHLQDSLLYLSTLSQAEQIKVVEKVIEDLRKKEEQTRRDSADREALAVAQSSNSIGSTTYQNPSQPRSNEWYFYNQYLMTQGRLDFDRNWGRRPLEDNWQRMKKASVGSSFAATDDYTATETDDNQQAKTEGADNPHSPEYYLAQIPKTDEQKNMALSQIATALYNMGAIFENKLKDDNAADETYKDFQTRFPQDERKIDTYYSVYRINGRLKNQPEQELFRNKIITEFSDSKYALMLSDINYTQKMQKLLAIQDSLYIQTYAAYTSGNYAAVKDNYYYIAGEYPLSELLPKFTFLNALAVAKTGTHEQLETELDKLIAKFPDSNVTPMSRDILALIRQGRENSQSTDNTTLALKRTEETKKEIDNMKKSIGEFSKNISEPQNIIFVCKSSNKTIINEMLYDVAAYNFNKFLVKDFDLDLRKINNKELLVVSGFESLEEAYWYRNLLDTDKSFAGKAYADEFSIITISNSNLQLLNAGHSLDEYLKFEQEKQKTQTKETEKANKKDKK